MPTPEELLEALVEPVAISGAGCDEDKSRLLNEFWRSKTSRITA